MDKDSIRILYLVAENWPTHRADVAALFAKYLPRYGIRTDLVTGRVRAQAMPEWTGGQAWLCTLAGGPGWRHIQRILHGLRVLFAADAERYQAIQVRDMPMLGLFGMLIARVKRIPFFYWVSYPVPEAQVALARERALSQGVLKFLFPLVRGRVGGFLFYRIITRFADHLFAQSVTMKELWAKRGVRSEKITAVPMGVDFEEFEGARVPALVDSRLQGRKVIVYMGILDRARRIELLFEMLRVVKEVEPTAILVLAGDAEEEPYRRWLEERARVVGVHGDVLWTGWLPRQEAWSYVRAARVALSPIPRGLLLDGASPTKVLEYLVLGVPVVCNDNPDQARLIDQTGAGLCVPYRPDAFAEAVLEVMSMDEAIRQQVMKNGYAYVQHERDYGKIAGDLNGVYRRLLNVVEAGK